MMGITFGDRLIDSGHYDITPEQEREIEAREECSRHGIDPDEICADGGVTAWMVMDHDLVRARSITCATCEDTGEIVWHHPEGGPSVEACPDCYQPGDCDGSCTHPKPDPDPKDALPDFSDEEIYEAIEELQSAAVMADQEPMEALFSDTALLIRSLIRGRDQANSETTRLREALEFYANPEIYKPHPHGPAFDRRDLSFHAISAISPNRDGGNK